MEQVLFALLVLIVGLLRVIMNVAEKKRNEQAAKRAAPQPPRPNAPAPRAPAETEEERIRRFMEALGVPTNVPPPKAPRRVFEPKPATTRPKRKIMPVDPFPVPRADVPPSSPPPVVVAAPTPAPVPPLISVPQPTVTTAAEPKQVPTFEVAELEWGQEGPAQAPATSASAGLVRQEAVVANQSWAARLGHAESLRDAIILREIFGPPRSLQPFELTAIAP